MLHLTFWMLFLFLQTNCEDLYNLTFVVIIGDYPLFTHWSLTNSNGDVLTSFKCEFGEPSPYAVNETVSITVNITDDCYTFEFGDDSSDCIVGFLDGFDPYLRSEYQVILNNIPLTIGTNGQSYRFDNFRSLHFDTNITFCTQLFDLSGEQEFNYNLLIEMDSYPINTILSISNDNDDDENNILYYNRFEETRTTTEANKNQSLYFTNIIEGCYTITFTDTSFDIIDSSLTHVMYVIQSILDLYINIVCVFYSCASLQHICCNIFCVYILFVFLIILSCTINELQGINCL